MWLHTGVTWTQIEWPVFSGVDEFVNLLSLGFSQRGLLPHKQIAYQQQTAHQRTACWWCTCGECVSELGSRRGRQS